MHEHGVGPGHRTEWGWLSARGHSGQVTTDWGYVRGSDLFNFQKFRTAPKIQDHSEWIPFLVPEHLSESSLEF